MVWADTSGSHAGSVEILIVSHDQQPGGSGGAWPMEQRLEAVTKVRALLLDRYLGCRAVGGLELRS